MMISIANCYVFTVVSTHSTPSQNDDCFFLLYFFSRNYKIQRNGMKQWYLLSVFLGDVIRDPMLCKRLAKQIPCDREISKAHIKY